MAKADNAKNMAFGGMMAALAVVILCMGGLIPLATYVCPMLGMLILRLVLLRCGSRVGWAWYGAVAILGLLLGPDKEAAATFLFLGYYPIVKPWLDRKKLSWLWKGLLFNASTLVMYWLLMNLFGMEQLTAEFREMETVLLAVTLLLGNLTFFLLDRVLSLRLVRRKHGT